MSRMTQMLFSRRKLLLENYYAGLTATKSIKLTADKYNAAYKTVEKDWCRRHEWEPLIWAIVSPKHSLDKLLNYLHLAEERAYTLTKTADNSNAQVGALKVLMDIIAKHVELQQSLGLLHKEPDKLAIEEKQAYLEVSQVLVEIVKKDNPDLVPKLYEVLTDVGKS